MRARLLIAFALGAVLGGAAVLLVTDPRPLDLPHAVAGQETVRILVAKRYLDHGTALAPKDLHWRTWSKAALPPGSFTSAEALFGEKGDQSRVVLRPIEPGEPVLEGKITKPDEAPPMEMDLGDGRRAVSIEVDTTSDVARFVALGDRVDIVLIREIESQFIRSLVLRDVIIVGIVDRHGGTTPDGLRSRKVTVKVDLREAQKLALAQQVGRLALTPSGIDGEPPALLPDIVPHRRPGQPNGCERPWSGYRGFGEVLLRPNLCRASFGGVVVPGPAPSRQPVPVRRGDFVVPRGIDPALRPDRPGRSHG